MIYVFNLQTTPSYSEEDVKINADCLFEAVSLFKSYIRTNYLGIKVVVSYFYVCVDDESMSLGEFPRDFYLEHFVEFQ